MVVNICFILNQGCGVTLPLLFWERLLMIYAIFFNTHTQSLMGSGIYNELNNNILQGIPRCRLLENS